MDISELVDKAGGLERIKAYHFPELPEEIAAIELHFQKFSCSINVNEDTDEIELNSPSKLTGLLISEVQVVFSDCIGHSIRWCWNMINNQGYSDGFKFEFENHKAFELIVEASSIKQFAVNKL